MSTPKVMRLVGADNKMECQVCGAVHWPYLGSGGKFVRGSWQCVNGCKLPPGFKAPKPPPRERPGLTGKPDVMSSDAAARRAKKPAK